MKIRSFLLPLAFLLLSSCTFLHTTPFDDEPNDNTTLVKITNHDWNAVTVYIGIQGSSDLYRIGFIETEQTETFRVDSRKLEESVLVVKEFATGQIWTSDTFGNLHSDDEIDLRVENQLSTTNYAIYKVRQL